MAFGPGCDRIIAKYPVAQIAAFAIGRAYEKADDKKAFGARYREILEAGGHVSLGEMLETLTGKKPDWKHMAEEYYADLATEIHQLRTDLEAMPDLPARLRQKNGGARLSSFNGPSSVSADVGGSLPRTGGWRLYALSLIPGARFFR